MTTEDILGKLQGVRKNGNGWTALCPAHDDKNASLSISGSDNGATLLKCFAGCPTQRIVESINLKMSDLFLTGNKQPSGRRVSSEAPASKRKRGKLHATPEAAAEAAAYGLKRKHKKEFKLVDYWVYHDSSRNEVGRVCRFENPDEEESSKQYRPIHPDGNGWRIGDPPGGFPLYRLPELLESPVSEPVFVVEGEKADDALAGLGLTVTTSAHGAGSAKNADWSSLAGRKVYVFPDNDPPKPDGTRPGMQYAEEVKRCICKLDPSTEIHIIELPDLPPKGDAVEFIEARRNGGESDEEIRDEIMRLAEEASKQKTSKGKDKCSVDLERVFLPGGARNVRITESAEQLGRLVGRAEKIFNRAGSVVEVRVNDDGKAVLLPVTPASMASTFESAADLYTTKTVDGQIREVAKNCTKTDAELIMESDAFVKQLPPLKLLTSCPVLIEHNGQLVTVKGYHRDTGIYTSGGTVEDIPLDKACELLRCLLCDFSFATPADLSRALAALITPALIHGGLLKGRAPLDLSEADQSQTGKGYRAKVVAAIYNATLHTITQRKGGTGSMEESFSTALIRGAIFVSIDNVRGPLASPALESALTEDYYSARTLYRSAEIDMRRVFVMLTSNKAELNQDLANRASPVLLRKQPDGYEYKTYPGGADILEHIRKNQGRFLGAAFAVVRAWYEAGCPRTAESRHDFRPWAQSLDWIVQNILGAAPLCDGLKETKVRMTTPTLNWLRDVALAVNECCRGDEWLQTRQILDILEEAGLDIPGMTEGADLSDEEASKKALQATGRKFASCFRKASSSAECGQEISTLNVDGIRVDRLLEYDLGLHKNRKKYRFDTVAVESDSIGADNKNEASTLSEPLQSVTVAIGDCRARVRGAGGSVAGSGGSSYRILFPRHFARM